MKIKNTALIVVDAQRYVMSDPDYYNHAYIKETFSNIKTLIRVFRDEGSPVIFTRMLVPPRKGFSIHPSVKPRKDDIIINKPEMSAFRETVLEDILLHLNVLNLVVCGFYTSFCVHDTAVDGTENGHNVAIAIDCSSDPEFNGCGVGIHNAPPTKIQVPIPKLSLSEFIMRWSVWPIE